MDVHDLQNADRPDRKRLFGDENSRSAARNVSVHVNTVNRSMYSRQDISDSFRVPQGEAGNQLADSIRVCICRICISTYHADTLTGL